MRSVAPLGTRQAFSPPKGEKIPARSRRKARSRGARRRLLATEHGQSANYTSPLGKIATSNTFLQTCKKDRPMREIVV